MYLPTLLGPPTRSVCVWWDLPGLPIHVWAVCLLLRVPALPHLVGLDNRRGIPRHVCIKVHCQRARGAPGPVTSAWALFCCTDLHTVAPLHSVSLEVRCDGGAAPVTCLFFVRYIVRPSADLQPPSRLPTQGTAALTNARVSLRMHPEDGATGTREHNQRLRNYASSGGDSIMSPAPVSLSAVGPKGAPRTPHSRMYVFRGSRYILDTADTADTAEPVLILMSRVTVV